MFQELLTNISRLAETTRISVQLYAEKGKIIIEIKYRGKTIKVDQGGYPSLGLFALKERALAFSGDLFITSNSNDGNSIICLAVPNNIRTI